MSGSAALRNAAGTSVGGCAPNRYSLRSDVLWSRARNSELGLGPKAGMIFSRIKWLAGMENAADGFESQGVLASQMRF
jgi:hypothetical protein